MQNKLLNSRPMMDIQDTYTLRGICMLMIIVHHVFKMYPDCPDTIMRWGFLGTSLFFFASGWGLYCSMNKRAEVDCAYFVSHIKKLLVPYLVIWPITELMYCIRYPEYFSALSLCRDFFTLTLPPYPGLWFLKVIFGAYVLSMLTFIIVKSRLWRLLIVSAFSIVYYVLAWKIIDLPLYWYGGVLCFAIGMWIAAYREKFKWFLNKKYLILALSILAYYLFFFHNLLPLPSRTMLCLAFSLAMVSLVSILNIANPICDYIGRNSLLFYLWHVSLCELILPPPPRRDSSQPLGCTDDYFGRNNCTLCVI